MSEGFLCLGCWAGGNFGLMKRYKAFMVLCDMNLGSILKFRIKNQIDLVNFFVSILFQFFCLIFFLVFSFFGSISIF